MQFAGTSKPDEHNQLLILNFKEKKIMSTTSGVFSETTLLNIRSKVDAMMFGDRVDLQYKARVGALTETMPKIMTANVTPFKDKKKNNKVEVEWMNACELVDQACTTCAVGGAELSTNTEVYELTQCREVPFTVNREDFQTNDFGYEEAVAKGILTADKLLSEYVVQQYLAFLFNSMGVNQMPAFIGDIGTVAGHTTNIATANWGADTVPYITKVTDYNQFTNPVNLSGNLLYNDLKQYQFLDQNLVQKGYLDMINSGNITWDIYNMQKAGLSDYLFSISQGAIAWASKAYYGPGLEDYGKEGKKWSINSQFIPGLVLEVHYNNDCVNDFIKENYNVKIRFDFWLNPAGCVADNTGVLSFHRV